MTLLPESFISSETSVSTLPRPEGVKVGFASPLHISPHHPGLSHKPFIAPKKFPSPMPAPKNSKSAKTTAYSASNGESGTTNQNLCDLFIQELASTLAGAEMILTSAVVIENWIHTRCAPLRDVARDVAHTARHCQDELGHALNLQRIRLSVTPNPAIVALLDTLGDTEYRSEPWGVLGTRVVSIFRNASLQMELQASDTADYAFLLGADALRDTLNARANDWAGLAARLHSKKLSFCAEAYVGETSNPAYQIEPNYNHNPQPISPCYAGLFYSSSSL